MYSVHYSIFCSLRAGGRLPSEGIFRKQSCRCAVEYDFIKHCKGRRNEEFRYDDSIYGNHGGRER